MRKCDFFTFFLVGGAEHISFFVFLLGVGVSPIFFKFFFKKYKKFLNFFDFERINIKQITKEKIMNLELPKLKPGLTFYYEAKCYKNKKIFDGDMVEKYFFEAIKDCQKKYTFKLLAAMMLPSAIHLLIRTIEGKESIMDIAFFILASIEDMYIRDTGRDDPVWAGINPITTIDTSKNPNKLLSEMNKFFRKAQINNITEEDINIIKHVDSIQETSNNQLSVLNF